jgi:hypothetical protein
MYGQKTVVRGTPGCFGYFGARSRRNLGPGENRKLGTGETCTRSSTADVKGTDRQGLVKTVVDWLLGSDRLPEDEYRLTTYLGM